MFFFCIKTVKGQMTSQDEETEKEKKFVVTSQL